MTTARLRTPVCHGLALGLGLLVLAFGARPGLSQSCDFDASRTPASGAPAVLWGDLKPTDIGTLPASRDSTDFNEFKQSPADNRLFMDVDAEAGWLFTAYTHGLQIWDIGGGKAANPEAVANLGRSSFLVFSTNPHEGAPVTRVDAPPGNANMLAVSTSVGFQILDTSTKGGSFGVYADTRAVAVDVYAGRLNGRSYAFSANSSPGGVTAYDMSAAVANGTCKDETPGVSSCGVYLGKLGSRAAASYVSGVGDGSGTRLWVAFGGQSAGFEIWDVTNPISPTPVLQDALPGEYLAGLAMFRSGGGYYAAVRVSGRPQSQARIYNVSCIASGSCSGLSSPAWSMSLSADLGVGQIDASESNGRTFLYYSGFLYCPDGLQQEWLFDASNPSAAFDLTPAPASVSGVLTGYWGYYYRVNPTGFNHVRPRAGVFYGDYFYRAAFGLLDVHTLSTPTPPVASFSWSPDPPYAGQTVSFTDTSTGQPTAWNWSFTGGTPATSTAQNPQVVFAAPGAKSVSLTAANGVGPNTSIQTVQVLDPAPVVTGIGVVPTSPVQCQPVTLEALGASGLPPLTFSWQVLDANQAAAPNFTPQNAASVVWNTAGVPAGQYSAGVTVSGSGGPNVTAQAPITLAALSPLPSDGSFTPTYDSFTQGTVQFHVSAPGATEYCWVFGDGGSFPAGCASGAAAWSTDPDAGPNPQHTYTVIGSYPVTVQVRNCVDTAPRTSAALTVNVTSVQPLIAGFQAQGICSPWTVPGVPSCTAAVGQLITFLNTTEGNPDTYEYDWAGDGVFEQTSPTAITTHSYATVSPAGDPYTPTLRVRRGAEIDVFVHAEIQIGTPTPKSIAVSGPSSGLVNQQLSFSATASGCVADPSGWSWTAAGGGITGSGSQVSIAWPTSGGKSVQATNSACGTATGTKSVSISASGGNPTTLSASFNYSPTNPEVGQLVTFTSTSVGATGFDWTFGDGGKGSGPTVTHKYASAGSYQVTLAAGKFDSSCPPFGYCEKTTSKVVTVTGEVVLTAAISTNAFCSTGICFVETGQDVMLQDISLGDVVSRNWDLGDGAVSTEETVDHVWRRPGSYQVVLSVSDGTDTSEAHLSFDVSGEATGGASTTIGEAPAATLLFPYFAVDLETPAGETTLIGISNVAAEPRLVQVTLWTNWGIPTVSFPVYLSGHDVYSLNVRDVFNGQLPVTGPVSSNRGLEDIPEKSFPACGENSDVPLPAIDTARLRAWHTGDASPGDGLCASAPTEPGIAVGYITVDVVQECSFSSPAADGYFAADGTGIASNENVLLGDFFFVDSAEDSAQSELAVHIRADEAMFGDGDYTFYGRYVNGDGSDKRQPLASVFESHYLNGGAFTGGTQLLVWRDTKSNVHEPVDCSEIPAWGPLPERQTVVFDEGGNVTFDGDGEHFPWATQRIDVGDSIPVAAPAGRVQMDLNHAQSDLFGEAAQAFVLATFSASGRFSVDLQAKALAGVSSDLVAETTLGGEAIALPSKRVAAEIYDASTFSHSCDVGVVPAATLLFPYFEVDLLDGGLDTLISFENTAAEPRLTEVTLWTDWGIPTLSFNVYLSGYDTETLSMRNVLNGTLPHTGPVSSSRNIETVPEVAFPGCGSTIVDVPIPFVDAVQLKAFHSGQPAPPAGVCVGSDQGPAHAVGFITVDVVNRCSLLRPSDFGYFEDGGDGVASNDNVLVGDFFLVNAAQNSAQGNAAVHLVADDASFGSGAHTFYARFVNGSGADNRQPLGSVYATRYLQGGAFSGGTQLIIWRDSKSPDISPVACGEEPSWSPLDKPRIEVMDEAGLTTYTGRRGGYQNMTQIVGVGGAKLPIEAPFGHLILDLNHEGSGLFGASAQAYVGVTYTADGRFSTAGSAHVLGRVCGLP